MKLSAIDLDVLGRMNKSPDGRYLVDLLMRKRAENDAALRTADGNELYRAQGRAQALDELISDLQEAEQRKNRSVQRAIKPVSL